MGDAAAMIMSDYGYGSATPGIARRDTRPERGGAVPVALDSRYRLHEYQGLGMTAATPNEAEIESAHHAEIGDRGELERLRGAH